MIPKQRVVQPKSLMAAAHTHRRNRTLHETTDLLLLPYPYKLKQSLNQSLNLKGLSRKWLEPKWLRLANS